MLAVGRRVRSLLFRRELASVFVMVFIADVVVGIYSPTFSLYATSLGASVAFVGVLSSVVGLTRIISSVPIGMTSDSRGRKGVLMFGMLLLAATSFLYTLASNAYQLLPIRLLHGIVITSTFFIGMAYAGDRVDKADRGLVSGVYTTCMGLGFAIGSALGGGMAARMGYAATFRAAGLLALVGFGVAWWGLSKPVRREKTEVRTVSPIGRLGMLAREPQLLAASLGYLLIILMFDAAIVNFFPLYAETLLIGQAAVGSMFAIRALASTSVRLPTGVGSTRFPSKLLMTIALVLGMVMVWSICFLTSSVALTIVLAGEGICFGMFLTSGQTFVTEQIDEADRGAAMGVYSTTGSIASTAGPFVLGAVAALWGLRSVFWFTGALVFLGILLFLYVGSRPSPSRGIPEADWSGGTR